MYDEYDAYLDELLEEAYLEGYYDSIDDYDDYYSEKFIYSDDDLDDMSLEELKALRKKELNSRKYGAIGTGITGAVSGYNAGASIFPNMILDKIEEDPDYKKKMDKEMKKDYRKLKKYQNNRTKHIKKSIAHGAAAGLVGGYTLAKNSNLKKIDRAIARKRNNY